ncbi:MAG TPA: hypothetical protein VGJ31_13275 [Dongiaceae bacterium]
MTDQSTRAADAPQFSIGKVLGTSFAVIGRNIVPFLLLAIMISIPSIVIRRMVGVDPQVYQAQINQQQTLYFASLSSLGSWISMFVSIVTSSLVTAALVYGTFQDLRGQRAAIGDLVGRGFSSLVPVVLAAIAYSLLLIVGTIMLLVPGVILATALWVYVPAIVLEKAGVATSFRRSRTLTKGHRWAILGLYLIVLAVVLAVEFVLTLVLHVSLAALAYHWAAIPIQLLYLVFIAVMSAVGYYHLRAEKEGISVSEIATVFD